MRSLSRWAFVLLAGAPVALARAQSPLGTYDAVIAKMPWDAAKEGPLFAVCPLRVAPGPSLDDLNRRKAVIGGLTALVPKTMVTVNSRFATAPNMYEGLPQEAKVTYLLRSLTPAQWGKATGEGISLSDLQGEQFAVMDSILPKPLVYRLGKVTDVNGMGRVGITLSEGKTTLSDAERSKVKLRIVRQLWLQIALTNGYTATDIKNEEKPAEATPYIERDEDGLFGQKVLVTGPNVPRKSQLDLGGARVGARLPLVPRERVEDCLARLGKATGLRLVADPHYAKMPIVERGESAVARDMLGALTLGVSGTFRRVGDTYVLINDLEGMAAHQARIAVYEDALTKEVERRVSLWRGEIVNGPGFRRIPFSTPLYDSLSPAEQENVAANDEQQRDNAYFATKDASKLIQETMRTLKNGLDVDREKVGISSNIRYQIILPGVGRAWWQGWLGNTNEYQKKPYVWSPPNPKPVPLPLEAKGAVAALALRADSPADAKRLVKRIAGLGVGELLLETRDPETLRAAVEAGAEANVKVGLAVRPWALGPGERSADPDRTATGEHGTALAASKRAIGPLQDFWKDNQAYEPPTRELIAPLDPAANAHLAWAAGLAGTKGLSRVVVLDLYPSGYGREDSNIGGSYFYSNAVDAYLAYGYTSALREAFLRSDNMDPLDLESYYSRTKVRLESAWGETFSPGQPFAKWQKAKGTASHERALALVRTLRAAAPGAPLTLAGEPPHNHLPPPFFTSLFEWRGEGELPVAPEDYGVGVIPDGAAFQMFELADDRDPAQRNRVADRLNRAISEHKRPVVLDLTSVIPARQEAVLAAWLR